ncbi:MAG: hypothetical protein JKX73_10520 [Flavobacteriales bacterium]|nr:hypothetical protein [Flavobacteriales bacterium]
MSELKAQHASGKSGHIIDLIPTPPKDFIFSNFSRFTEVEQRTIRPGDYNDLLVAKFDTMNITETDYRTALREFLKDLTVWCDYTDVYGSRFSRYKVECKWYGRHFK